MLFVVTATVSSVAWKRYSGMRWVLLVACLGVSGEWLTTLLPIPIHLAVSQFRQTMLIQIASVTGIWGVSFLIWFTNAAIADRRAAALLPHEANRARRRRYCRDADLRSLDAACNEAGTDAARGGDPGLHGR